MNKKNALLAAPISFGLMILLSGCGSSTQIERSVAADPSSVEAQGLPITTTGPSSTDDAPGIVSMAPTSMAPTDLGVGSSSNSTSNAAVAGTTSVNPQGSNTQAVQQPAPSQTSNPSTQGGTVVAQEPAPSACDLMRTAISQNSPSVNDLTLPQLIACGISVKASPLSNLYRDGSSSSGDISKIQGNFSSTYCFVRFEANEQLIERGTPLRVSPDRIMQLGQHEARLYLRPMVRQANGGYFSTELACYHGAERGDFTWGEISRLMAQEMYMGLSF